MIAHVRKFFGVFGTIACLLCFVLLLGSGDVLYLVAMIALGFFVNWVYPDRRKRNGRN